MSPLKVAIVGAGAAGMYCVLHLLERLGRDVHIDLFERVPTPWGLIRSGVAPDHLEKKQIADRLFQLLLAQENIRYFGNVEIGRHLSHVDICEKYHAVVYAVGASDDKSMGIGGEHLPGSWSARQFVAWYSGHPDFRGMQVDLATERAVVVGTGNVALDVARVLTMPVATLSRTDIADHALSALARSRVQEVVVLGRRGSQHAAFNNAELEELLELDDVEVKVVDESPSSPPLRAGDWVTQRKLDTLARLQSRPLRSVRKRISFRFEHVPVAVIGESCVEGVQVDCPHVYGTQVIDCGLLLRSIGYRGARIPGLPFDELKGVVPSQSGRVIDRGKLVPGVYVAGWIKRGPRGIIGTNKRCALETVSELLEDAQKDALAVTDERDVTNLLADRGCEVVSKEGWSQIDAAERRAGQSSGRPRVKLIRIDDLLSEARANDG